MIVATDYGEVKLNLRWVFSEAHKSPSCENIFARPCCADAAAKTFLAEFVIRQAWLQVGMSALHRFLEHWALQRQDLSRSGRQKSQLPAGP